MPRRVKKRTKTEIIEEGISSSPKKSKAELLREIEAAVGPLTPEEVEQLGLGGRSKGIKPADKPRYRMTGREGSVRLGDRMRMQPTGADQAQRAEVLRGRTAGRIAGQIGAEAGATGTAGIAESFWAAATGNEHKKMQGLIRQWIETNLPESMAAEKAALIDASNKGAKRFTADLAKMLKGAAGGAPMKAAAVDTIMWATVKEAIGEKAWAEKLKTDTTLAGRIAAKRSSIAAAAESAAPGIAKVAKSGAAAIGGKTGPAGLMSLKGAGKLAAGFAAWSAAGHLIDKATGAQDKVLREEYDALRPPSMDDILAQIQQEREIAAAYTPPAPGPMPTPAALGARRYGVPSGGASGGAAGGGVTDLAALLAGSDMLG